MKISKDKKKEILLKNFDIIKNNYEKNRSSYSEVIGKMFSIDADTAIDMWIYLIKKFESEVKGYNSFSITCAVLYDGKNMIGNEEMEKIIIETPELKNAFFSLMHSYVAQYCGPMIRRKISNDELMVANELLELLYNNPYKSDSWYKIMEECFPYSNTCELSEEAIELLELWCDKIEDEEERAKLSIKMLDYYD